MDKIVVFGNLEIDKGSGSGKLEVQNKRLMDEEMLVVMEILRRYTEIQHVIFRKCFLDDETFARIMAELVELRHLRTLSLVANALTSVSANLIVTNFKDRPRRIMCLDLRENLLVCILITSFSTPLFSSLLILSFLRFKC